MNRAIIHCSLPLIQKLLKLPEDVKLIRVRQTWEQQETGQFEILVEAPTLPETHPGQVYPWADVIIHTEFCREDEISHIVKGEITV